MADMKYRFTKVLMEDGTYSRAIAMACDASAILFDDGESLVDKLSKKSLKEQYGNDGIHAGDADLTFDENFEIIEITEEEYFAFNDKYTLIGNNNTLAIGDELYDGHIEGCGNKGQGNSYVYGLDNEGLAESAIIGNQNIAKGNSYVSGNHNYANEDSLAFGNNTAAYGNAIVTGDNTVAGNSSFTSGIYNKPLKNTYRIIGNGTEEERKNIYVLDKQGNVFFNGEINAKYLIGATKIYDKNGIPFDSYVHDVSSNGLYYTYKSGDKKVRSLKIDRVNYAIPFLDIYKSDTIGVFNNTPTLIYHSKVSNIGYDRINNDAVLFLQVLVNANKDSTLKMDIRINGYSYTADTIFQNYENGKSIINITIPVEYSIVNSTADIEIYVKAINSTCEYYAVRGVLLCPNGVVERSEV